MRRIASLSLVRPVVNSITGRRTDKSTWPNDNTVTKDTVMDGEKSHKKQEESGNGIFKMAACKPDYVYLNLYAR